MDLSPLFSSRSIVIIGASNNPSKFGGRPLQLLKRWGYSGRLYAVNPRRDSVQGVPSYSGLSDLPDVPELAILAVQAALVPETLRDCGQAGVRACIVLSSGFAEAGPPGVALQGEVARIVEEFDLTLLGPGALGTANLPEGMVAYASGSLNVGSPCVGSVDLVSQSGAMGGLIYHESRLRGLGIKRIASTGTEAHIDAAQIVRHWLNVDPPTAVGMFLEGVRSGSGLQMAFAEALERDIPICVVKAGTSEAGAAAAQAHTASLTDDFSVFSAMAKEFGVLQAADPVELADTLHLVGAGIRLRDRRVAVITASGGAGVLLADRLTELNFDVVGLSAETTSRLSKAIPSFGSADNPVDVTAQVVADPDLIADSVEILVKSGEASLVVLVLAFLDSVSADLAECIVAQTEVAREAGVALVVVWPGINPQTESHLLDNRVPLFRDIGRFYRATGVLGGGWQGSTIARRTVEETRCVTVPQRSNESSGRELFNKLRLTIGDGGSPLPKRVVSESLSKGFLSDVAAMAVPASKVVRDASRLPDAVSIVGGFPVVLKGDAHDVLHKSELGLVRVGIRSFHELRSAFRAMGKSRSDSAIGGIRFIVEENVAGNSEFIVGCRHTDAYGIVAVIGFGGVDVDERRRDEFLHFVAPLSATHIVRTVSHWLAIQMPVATNACHDVPSVANRLAQAVLSLESVLEQTRGVIRGIEINPFVFTENDDELVALDAVIELDEEWEEALGQRI